MSIECKDFIFNNRYCFIDRFAPTNDFLEILNIQSNKDYIVCTYSTELSESTTIKVDCDSYLKWKKTILNGFGS